MGLQTLKAVTTRAATIVGAVVITAVVVSGSLSVAQAAMAAVPNNSVNSAKIVDNSIQSVDVKNNSLTSADILNGTLTSADVRDQTLARADIADNAIGTFQIADQNVNYADLNPLLRPRYAKVATGAGDTALLRGRGATAVSRIDDGQYDVTFDTNITNCGWIATRNDDAGGVAGNGEIAIEQANAGDPNRLRIRLFNSAGAQTEPSSDDGFTVIVAC